MTAEWWHCTRDEYDADVEYVRSSALKDFADCPRVYWARHIAKAGEHGHMGQKRQSREMVLGTALHAAALEGKRDWIVASNCQAKLKSGDNEGQQCGKSTANGGYCEAEGVWLCGTHGKKKELTPMNESALTPAEDDQVSSMATALLGNQDAIVLLSDRFHERAARSVDPDTGVKKKALIDIVVPRPFTIADIKTTGEFNAESIWRKIDQNCWGLSFSHYESVIMDIQRAHGKPVHFPLWIAIVVESIPPYRVELWPLDEIADDARREYRELLAEFAECQRTGEWRQRPLNTAMPQWYGFRHGMMQEGSR